MANPAQSSTSVLRRGFGLPAVALALFCALTIVARESAAGADLECPLQLLLDRQCREHSFLWLGHGPGGKALWHDPVRGTAG